MTEEQENLSRRERRARAKGDDDNESVKDRNQRLRNEAASKRRAARRSERQAAASTGLDAGERMDDALVRSADATGRFVRSNFAWLQWIIILGVAGAITILVVDYRRGVAAEKRGHRLAEALDSNVARVVSSEPPQQTNLVDTREEFPSAEEKNKEAIAEWRKLEQSNTKELATIARLNVAGSLFDLGKFAEARAAYQKADQAATGPTQLDVRARAVEGVGLSFEAEENYAEAKKAFQRLGNLDGYAQLSQFHSARIEYLSGDRAAALSILEPLNEKLSENAGPDGPRDYLGAAVRDLLKTVDPQVAARELAELKKKQEAEQQERFRKMLEEMQKKAQKDGGSPLQIPGMPPAPGPGPSAPDEEGDSTDEAPGADQGSSEAASPPAASPSAASPPAPTPAQKPAPGKAPTPAPQTAPAPPAPQGAPVPAPRPVPAPVPAAPAPAPQKASAPAEKPQAPAAPETPAE